jgi:FlaA1/EpsC-like NDP-sugar epimerase
MISWGNFFSNQKKTIPRWVVFSIDIALCTFSLFLAYLLRYNFHINEALANHNIATSLALVLFFRVIAFAFMKTYAGIIRYTGSQDAVRIFIAVSASSLIIYLVNVSYFYFFNRGHDFSLIPTSVIIIDFLVTVVCMTSLRLAYKLLFQQIRNASIAKTKVLIYGAGQLGVITKRTLDHDTSSRFKIVGFIDNDRSKAGKFLEGTKIYYGDENLESILEKGGIDQVIISIQDLTASRKTTIIETCLNYGVNVSSIPPVNKWINGEFGINQIKNVRIEDLLGRDAIELDNLLVSQQLKGKCIMVTGAAGSIGSELARQIIKLNPLKLILIDQAETPLYELEFEFRNELHLHNIHAVEFIVADICNEHYMRQLMDKLRPDKVFHAAAYKHVPLMESHPSQAVMNNVLGTKILADLSIEFGVSKFVMVSTDKAVNPTNVMGASKRIAEIYVQSLNNHLSKKNNNHTRFITTRFGNVLGSNGSVIPVFRKQIENGGPITVTHPDITRYFMTIPEACQLVLEAGAMGKGGEIYIFDMGQSVKIIDLARKMIKLSGLEPDKDIHIQFTGLRPGEKIFEELLNDKENAMATHHPKIMIGKVRQYDFESVCDSINNLIISSSNESNDRIVQVMKQIVPEFISNNSIYELLDAEDSNAERTNQLTGR